MTTPNEERAGHTPWSVKPKFSGDGFHIMSAPIGGRTFRLFSSDCASEADALKAAAAPELLDAAEKWGVILTVGIMHSEPSKVREAMDDLAAAIAKARGEA
ncbi:hypothetical protein GRI72_02810 [Altererythrobacter marinus]|uniref:Uncharacterized protein n=1 Tax=Pelagerythrobacter marinus TaxID=538382 RepID=A0ABW9UUF6_9SPHN|nr:hypothetical protein [Pelagerythrobacter marinus]MXO67763.1 hypothetical protein [Pelagerythrobacter marinus]